MFDISNELMGDLILQYLIQHSRIIRNAHDWPYKHFATREITSCHNMKIFSEALETRNRF